MNLHKSIADQAEQFAERVAIEAPGREPLTYAQLSAHIQKAGKCLNDLGIGRNDAVATVLPNGPEMAVAFLSIAGVATCAPLNPAYQAAEFEFYLSDLAAKAVLILKGMESPAREVARAMNLPTLELVPDEAGPAGLFTIEAGLSAPASNPGSGESDNVALVLHTSGTTSRPKIVPLTQANLLASADNIKKTLQLTPQDRCLNVMPLFHIHGLVAAVLASLSAGASVVCTPGFYVTEFFGWMDQTRPTWYTAVPTMHQAILARAVQQSGALPIEQLRFVRSSSSSLAPQVMKQLETLFKVPVIEAYGMTEAAHQMASNPFATGKQKPGSVGLPAGPQVAIMAEDSPDVLPEGELGEIVIRGTNVTAGYANNPAANAKAFADGWFRTGDQGYIDEDGYLYIAGRLKELINRGGEKISPREIDEVLLAHPAVASALTFAMPDPLLGEGVAAAVVLKDKTVTERDIRLFVSQRLADFKVPQRVVILDEIPKGPTGKLQRIGLAQKLGLSAPLPVAPMVREYAVPQTQIELALAEIWKEVLKLPQVGLNDRFIELGGDSMLAARLVAQVSKELGIKINLIDFGDTPTIADQAQIVERLKGKQIDAADQNAGFRFVTAIHAEGGKPPFFFLSASASDSFIFPGLAQGLGQDQPLFGLTPFGINARNIPDGVDLLAEKYLQEIRAIQPHGPYDLGGNCSGGIVAYEVAQRLDAAGEKVRLLVLTESYGLDYPVPGKIARRMGNLPHIFYVTRKHLDVLANSPWPGRRHYLHQVLGRQVRRIQTILRSAQASANNSWGFHFRPGKNYAAEKYRHDMVLFKAAHQPYGIHPDETLGWQSLVQGRLTIIEVPGYHGGIYSGARASALGARISGLLQDAR